MPARSVDSHPIQPHGLSGFAQNWSRLMTRTNLEATDAIRGIRRGRLQRCCPCPGMPLAPEPVPVSGGRDPGGLTALELDSARSLWPPAVQGDEDGARQGSQKVPVLEVACPEPVPPDLIPARREED